MCFHEAEKLNAGSHSKTFLGKPSKAATGGHASLSHKTSKAAIGAKQAPAQPQQQQLAAGMTLTQPSTNSIKGGGKEGGAGHVGGASGLLEEDSQVYMC